MIPNNAIMAEEIVSELSETRTYRFDMKNRKINGYTDGIEALKQAVVKILNTERQDYVIYSTDYGIETRRFIGQDIIFVMADVERTIKEALIVDERIQDIVNFKMDKLTDGLHVSFTLQTIYGDVDIEKGVRI